MHSFVLLAACATLSFAKTVTYNFDIGWVSAAPDGYTRPVIGINGQWPIPTIEADVGDTIVVNAHNSLGNQSTSLHFHGMFQKGTPTSDGAVGVGQCSIAPGDSYTYSFTANPAGTHWYHSHDRGQYPDGLRGKMIIHDPAWEKSLNIDQQLYLSISDWYHTQFPYIVHNYLSPDNTNGVFPSPDTLLFNDTRKTPNFNFQPGKRYLLRIVNYGSVACSAFYMAGHTLTVVGIDGVQTQPVTATTISICVGQRYDVVVQASNNLLKGAQFIAKMSTDMLTEAIPSDTQLTVIGNITYSVSLSIGLKKVRGLLDPIVQTITQILTPSWVPQAVLDDMTCKPLAGTKLYAPPTLKINQSVNQTFYPGIGSRIAIGSDPWVEPKVPTLYSALSTGEFASDPATYGVGVDPYISQPNDVVQVNFYNGQSYPHPMHLHGHEFQVVARGSGTWNGNTASLPSVPMMRDVVTVPANGYVVLRWPSDNPGVWFFHCHIDLHLVGGMASVFVENPTQLQQIASIPAQGISVCKNSDSLYSGNCAGQQGNITLAETRKVCNTIFNTNDDGEAYGAEVGTPP